MLRFSARSRVRGQLEIYHAFVRDLDASTSSAASDSDWDVIDDEAGTPTSVSIIDTCVLFSFILCNLKNFAAR